MPTIKLTTCFNGSSNDGGIVFGFSETWYTDQAADAAVAAYKGLCLPRRLALLPEDVSVYGYRVQPATVKARSYTIRDKDGSAGPAANGGCNVPQDAALCRVFGALDGIVKNFWVHCLPDSFIETAGFVANAEVEALLRSFIGSVIQAGFKIRYQVPNAPAADILDVTAGGLVTLAAPVAGAVIGAKITVLHTRDRFGRAVRGTYKISNLGYTNTQVFTLMKWPGAEVVNSGTARLVQYDFTAIAPLPRKGAGPDPVIRPGVRKCGRPFGQLRGRVANRR